jgi:CRISPR/Cas system-associated exonuclease Cas4 (RecB family)
MSAYVKRYNPHRSDEWNYGGQKWRLSRSKIDLFIECPRCFYIDNKLGTARPRGPAFTLNIAVDELFKKEFDVYRKTATKHPLIEKYNLDAVPYQHKDIDIWRDNFKGIEHIHTGTGFTVSGAIDDVWVLSDGTLLVVDYKATSKDESITTLADSSWEDQYKRQMGIYQWIFKKNGFPVSSTGYFVYTNADTRPDSFNDTLHFETTLIPCEGDLDWIEPTLVNIKKCLDNPLFPDVGSLCEFCPYRETCGKKLQNIYNTHK